MLVTVLLLPPVEFIVVRVIDMHRVWIRTGRNVPLFPIAFIRGHVFEGKKGADIRVVGGKELELRQEVLRALEMRRGTRGAFKENEWIQEDLRAIIG